MLIKPNFSRLSNRDVENINERKPELRFYLEFTLIYILKLPGWCIKKLARFLVSEAELRWVAISCCQL